MKRALLVCVLVAAATPFLVIAGCKQGDDERCQVHADCESGECNAAKGTCSSGTSSQPIEAGVTDAPPPDAAPDAPPDAP